MSANVFAFPSKRLTVSDARKFIRNDDLTDEQVEELIEAASGLAKIAVDMFRQRTVNATAATVPDEWGAVLPQDREGLQDRIDALFKQGAMTQDAARRCVLSDYWTNRAA